MVPAAAEAAGALRLGPLVALAGPAARHSAACSRCHGLDGSGGGAGAFPRLDGQDARYLQEALRSYASGARPSGIMTSIIRGISDAEREAVAAYYAALPRRPRAAAPGAPDPLGRTLAEDGAPRQGVPPCAECHGADGIRGQPLVPYLAGQHAPYLALQLRLWKSGVRGADGNAAAMAEVARRLTAEQIEAAARYYATLP
jgi:cytochrome c553